MEGQTGRETHRQKVGRLRRAGRHRRNCSISGLFQVIIVIFTDEREMNNELPCFRASYMTGSCIDVNGGLL